MLPHPKKIIIVPSCLTSGADQAPGWCGGIAGDLLQAGCDLLSFTSFQNFFYIQGCSIVVDSDATNFLPSPFDKL